MIRWNDEKIKNKEEKWYVVELWDGEKKLHFYRLVNNYDKPNRFLLFAGDIIYPEL